MKRKKQSKTDKAARVGQILAGLRKRFPNGSQNLTLDGAPVTVDATAKELQSFLDGRAAVVAAKATVASRVAAENNAMAALDALLKALVAFLRVTFGSDPEALADFGLQPPAAPAPMTAEAKAAAAAKREATRAARGTTSAKQKKAIHGNVTATLVVTPAAPAAATPPVPAAPPPNKS